MNPGDEVTPATAEPTPAVADGSMPLPELGPTRLALFDLDRTLLPSSSLVTLARTAHGRGMLRMRELAPILIAGQLFKLRGHDQDVADRTRDRALSLSAGVPVEALNEALDDVADLLVAQVRPAMRLLLDMHLRHGDLCVVLSASPQFLVQAVAQRLGAHRGVGTPIEIADGVLTGRLEGRFCHGADKLVRLEESIGEVDLSQAWAYADSFTDLPVLEACGRPIPVCPDDDLRRVAEERGWPVLDLAPEGGRRWRLPLAGRR